MESEKQCQPILILGGSNFMGRELVGLLDRQSLPSQQIYCINRGKVHWNDQVRKNKKYIHYAANRKEHEDFSKTIQYLNRKLNISEANPWRAVVDFSAFKWRDLQSSTKPILGKTNIYIFISSDSIYNASSSTLDLPISEKNFQLSENYNTEKLKKKKKDKYGYNKLKCEIYLEKLIKQSNFPAVSLRLPDVIGPYDDTDRFWCYIQWIQQNQRYKIPLNQLDKTSKLNFVYSVDVAHFIKKIILTPELDKLILSSKPSAYNLGFRELVTLKEFLDLIGSDIKIDKVRYLQSSQKSTNNFFPSTTYGVMDLSKVSSLVDSTGKPIWEPTPIKQAIKNTVGFFRQAKDKYPLQYRQMIEEFRQRMNSPMRE